MKGKRGVKNEMNALDTKIIFCGKITAQKISGEKVFLLKWISRSYLNDESKNEI
jgi:hypothetical protein